MIDLPKAGEAGRNETFRLSRPASRELRELAQLRGESVAETIRAALRHFAELHCERRERPAGLPAASR